MNTVDLAKLKASVDLVAVVQSRGVKLARQGKDFVGLCPFHEEKTPSFHVTPAKNLFHCPGCKAGGSVIDFVMRRDGLTKSQAIAWLKESSGAAFVRTVPATLPARILKPQDAEALLQRVVTFYSRTLRKDEAGMSYLNRRNLSGPTLLEVFRIGYANGSLHQALPKSGDIIRGLKTLGVLNSTGQEHFRGCITVPIFDSAGHVAGIYGRRVTEDEPHHLYLPGPHRGVFNGAAAKTGQTLFVTEAIFDALSLWQAGYRNTVALYGANGWTPDHTQLLQNNGTTEIYLCLDNDATGTEATARLEKEILPPLVKKVHVIRWPQGVKDANDFFLSRSPADFQKQCLDPLAQAQAGTEPPKSELTEKLTGEEITMTPDGFTARYHTRRYELRAIEQQKQARLRATVKAVSQDAASAGRFHIDTVDFYVSRSRRLFIGEAARLFREAIEIIEADMNRLISQVEAYARKQLAEHTSQVVLVSDPDKTEAVKLGKHPDLSGEILRDMDKLGLIGEATNKLMGYLTMTSRRMPDPLALLILSGSGAGKSLLQDAVLRLCPEEDLIKLTSLSDRALFYKGEDSLRHKVLAVEEVAGAEGACYAIRNLISAKKLVIETTVKNPMTGQLTTQLNTVYGPTAVFQTTTKPDLDAETRSRFMVTSIDESPEQTRAILAAQRHGHTLDGMKRQRQREIITRRHHAFQRLLNPVTVVNPFEPLLTYAEDRLAVRRDNPKYLNLILAVTFLHQMQRPVQHDADLGDYIETDLADIAIANELATALFGQSLDELSRPGHELLRLLFEYAQRQADRQKTSADKITFSRRELRETLKWSEYQLRTYLDELAGLEYVWPLSGRQGMPFRYRLLWDGQGGTGGRFLPGLKSAEQLRQEAAKLGFGPAEPASRPKIELRGEKSPLRGEKGNFEGTSLNGSNEVKPPLPPLKSGLSRNGGSTSSHFAGNVLPEMHHHEGRAGL